MKKSLVPRINTNEESVEIVRWYVARGDYIEKGNDLVDLGTSKATMTITAEESGFVHYSFKQSELAKVGEILAEFYPSLDTLPAVGKLQPSKTETETKSAQANGPEQTFRQFDFCELSPAAELYMKEKGISLSQLDGFGLVTARYLRQLYSIPVTTTIKPTASESLSLHESPNLQDLLPSREEQINRFKKAEIRSLTIGAVGNVTSSLTLQIEFGQIAELLSEQLGISNAIQPILLYEISQAAKKNPKFTAFYHNEKYYFYDRVDLGIAVDLGKGLKVVTIRNADCLFPAQFAEATMDIAMRDAQNALNPEELSGSTITVSDLSGAGILHFQPLINGYQSVIIGIGGDLNSQHKLITLTVTFDHRILSGREVSSFLQNIRKSILSYKEVNFARKKVQEATC